MNKNRHFQTIGIVGKPRYESALETHLAVYNWLKDRHYTILVEAKIAQSLNLPNSTELAEIGQKADLIIVIGGDGNMLGMARYFAPHQVPLIGINRGNLGFLTDIAPQFAFEQLYSCLEKGEYELEERFLLEAIVERNGKKIASSKALNEVVIHPSQVTRTIEFEVYIDGKFAFTQLSDGLIIATPTGSTAYSLSAGGPILTPNMNAIALVPMYPHTLSSRPLVIDGESHISMRFAQHKQLALEVSCDGQVDLPFTPDDRIVVRKSSAKLKLLHLKDYNYFTVLASKLGWGRKLF